jgi:hypothetical protein
MHLVPAWLANFLLWAPRIPVVLIRTRAEALDTRDWMMTGTTR